MQRTRISERVKKKLRQETENRCPICGEDNEFTFEYHHIKPVAEGGKSEEKNLILLCSNCHSKVTHSQIEESEILRVKKLLSNDYYQYRAKKTARNVIDFSGINKGQVANNIEKIEIKTQNKTVKINPPPGAIASSLLHRNYIKSLVDKYHKFKKSEVGQEKMKYSILHDSIKREFGAKWDMIPLERFNDLSAYLQDRIDKTILGKIHKAKGRRSYSTFEEYIDKHCR